MAKLECYNRPNPIKAPDIFEERMYSDHYLSECEPADFDKDSIDKKIQELADLLFNCDDIYSNCETIENDIVKFLTIDDIPLDIFDLPLCRDIMFKIKDISEYGIEHLKERTSEVQSGLDYIGVWLYRLNSVKYNDPEFNEYTYKLITEWNAFDYGSWVPKR